MRERRRCFTFLLLGFIWLYVFMISCTLFRVKLHSIVAWISRNSLLKTGAVSSWVFVYELSGCRLESCCSHQCLFLTIFLAQRRITFSALYLFFHRFGREDVSPFKSLVFHRGMSNGICDLILYLKNEGLKISWVYWYNSIPVLKNGIHNTVFYSVSSWM